MAKSQRRADDATRRPSVVLIGYEPHPPLPSSATTIGSLDKSLERPEVLLQSPSAGIVHSMRGQRVLVSGMGGELGSLVASLLEAEPWVGSILGVDVDPPRRRLRRSEFHLIDPGDRQRIVDVVTPFDPHVLVHLAVWEPDARAGTAVAKRLTSAARRRSSPRPRSAGHSRRSSCVAASRSTAGRGALTRPDEEAPTRPTSEYGRMVADIEATAHIVGERVGVAVSAVRLAPCSAHTCRARSVEFCVNRSYRSACSPTRRSP